MNNEEFLISVYQNTKTAMQSIEDMYPKFRNSRLKQLMEDEQQQYKTIMEKCVELSKQKNIELKDNNIFQKTMLWTSINFSTLTNKSSSHIAELFLLGTVRGTLKLYKDLKNNKNIDTQIIDIAKQLLEFEEQSFERIKKYLKE
ncbi:MAG: hypothetical protein J6Q51_01265 [Clostridia bacterium]|nr:hypothetical protein [Clostridia bacterium]